MLRLGSSLSRFGLGSSIVIAGGLCMKGTHRALKPQTPCYNFSGAIKRDKEMIDRLFRKGFQEGRIILDEKDTYGQLKQVLEHGIYDVCPKTKSIDKEALGFIYTPGVGEVCSSIHKHPELVDKLTTRKRNVMILTDGSVLGVDSSKLLPILDWLIVQIKYYTGLDAYPFALPKGYNLEDTLKDLSNGYGAVLILENIKPQKIPKDLIVLSHRLTCDIADSPIFDAEKSANVLSYLINEEKYGWANEEAIEKNVDYSPLTLTVHSYYNERIHDKGYKENAMRLHEFHRGKVNIELNFTDILVMKKLFSTQNLRKLLLEEDPPSKSKKLSIIVTDGTAILGLGKIGPRAGLPVMEGKSVLFKYLGNVDVIPLCINRRQNIDNEIEAIRNYGYNFAAINMEDISAPSCFKIEGELRQTMKVPVFHDDQHGTAIIILAGLINSCKVLGKDIKKAKVVINGAGAAGISLAKLLARYGVEEVILCDSHGAIYQGRKDDMNPIKDDISLTTNKKKIQGKLKDVLPGTDIFVGLSVGGVLKPEWVKLMDKKSIIFALANPDPEIDPNDAIAAGVSIMATGRSDFPNQINNSLVFPGIFRSIIDHHLENITPEMEIAAAKAIASSVKGQLTETNIVPQALDHDVVITITEALGKIAQNPTAKL